jgi:flagellar motor switch protein FliN/FliY
MPNEKDTAQNAADMPPEDMSPEEMNGSSGINAMPFTPLSISATGTEGENSSLIMDLSLPVAVELGRTTMLIKDLVMLAPGAVIELDKLVGEPVDLLVNDKKLAEGEVVVVDETFAVRITSITNDPSRSKRRTLR